jgi:peptidoglycan/xylan/chitin deacetylase (PgdA/CDA1 family)
MSRMQNTRRLVSWAWIYFLHYTGLLRWVRRRIASSSSVVVLTLHRVLEDLEFDRSDSPQGMVVRCRTFEQFLLYIKENFDLIALSGDSPTWSQAESRPRIALTFDDGWKDTSELAHPLLIKHQVPITLFVCPGLLGLLSPFWPEVVCRGWKAAKQSEAASHHFSAICAQSGIAWRPNLATRESLEGLIALAKALPPKKRDTLVQGLRNFADQYAGNGKVSPLEATMTWEGTEAMLHAGVRIGSHTQNHEILTGLELEHARQEIRKSKAAIESRLGTSCLMFAYPNGSWSQAVRDLVESEKYSQAFINSPGIWNRQTDPLLIPRVNLWEGSLTGASGKFSPIVFAYSVFWRAFVGRFNGHR